jgi:hypothetical protein
MSQQIFNQAAFLPQKSIALRTWIKSSILMAFREVFNDHPDNKLQTQYDANGNYISGTKISLEYPNSEQGYPSLVIRLSGLRQSSAGVGHIEYILDVNDTNFYPYKHYHYQGTVELLIFALSSLDRDLLADSVVQTVVMPEMQNYTNQYFNQIFNTEQSPPNLNYLNINIDNITDTGDQVTQQPWLQQGNYFQYQTSFRTNFLGEYYSLPPDTIFPGLISAVELYPYTNLSPLPPGVPALPLNPPPDSWPL